MCSRIFGKFEVLGFISIILDLVNFGCLRGIW